MAALGKLTRFLSGPLRFLLSNAALDVKAVQADMIGRRITDGAPIESRTTLSGGPMETSGFLSRRPEGVHLFLTVTEHMTGSQSTRSYPIGPRGISALSGILSEDADKLFPRPERDAESRGVCARFWQWLKEPLEGGILRRFGRIDDLSLRNSPGAPDWWYEQGTEAMSSRKRGEDLLVLQFRYRMRGGPSGVVSIPFGASGRLRLHEIVKEAMAAGA